MIPLRILLRALAYILHGRADWMDRKALDNRKSVADDPKRAGRLKASEQIRRQASEVGRMTHEHEQGVVMVPAGLVGFILARATGHLEGKPELLGGIGSCQEPLKSALEKLVAIGVLPIEKKE